MSNDDLGQGCTEVVSFFIKVVLVLGALFAITVIVANALSSSPLPWF